MTADATVSWRVEPYQNKIIETQDTLEWAENVNLKVMSL